MGSQDTHRYLQGMEINGKRPVEGLELAVVGHWLVPPRFDTLVWSVVYDPCQIR